MFSYNGYFKVGTDGYSLTRATFFNPSTKESFTKIIWNIDDDRLHDDPVILALYHLPINETARRLYLRHIGVIQVGDLVEVYKGRKVPKGYRGVVTKFSEWRDTYGRVRTTYVHFEDGQRTSISNCRLVEE